MSSIRQCSRTSFSITLSISYQCFWWIFSMTSLPSNSKSNKPIIFTCFKAKLPIIRFHFSMGESIFPIFTCQNYKIISGISYFAIKIVLLENTLTRQKLTNNSTHTIKETFWKQVKTKLYFFSSQVLLLILDCTYSIYPEVVKLDAVYCT